MSLKEKRVAQIELYKKENLTTVIFQMLNISQKTVYNKVFES